MFTYSSNDKIFFLNINIIYKELLITREEIGRCLNQMDYYRDFEKELLKMILNTY